MAFLRQQHPFSQLDEDGFAAVAQSLQIVHVPAGETVLIESGAPADAVGVVRKGAMELVIGEVVVDQVEAGEMYGFTSAMTRQSPSMHVRAAEDTLSYLVPADVARRVFASERGVASARAMARQRVRAADLARIGSLVRRPAVTIRSDASVADAATLMRDERVSCLVIELGDGRAIVTDRDLRTRVIAERGSFDAPVLDVATRPVRVAGADTIAGEALLDMLTHTVHHLPVVEGARLIGVVTDTDLMGLERESPFAIRSAIARARSDTDVIEAARTVRTVASDMVVAGADPLLVARIVSVIADAATERFLELAPDELGEPPSAYAWLALGTAARRELALDGDQSHALALGPGGDAHDAYFAALAERVTAGLEEVGFPRCHGDAMAVHPAMRATLASWAQRLRTWIHQPEIDEGPPSVALDFRVVGGSLEVEATLEAAVAEARTDAAFLHRLAHLAVREEPPTGFIRGLVVGPRGDHGTKLDLHGGIDIVTAIARARAIAAGASATDTLSRLEAAVQGGTLSRDSGGELAETFRFLFDLRLRHQAAQVRDGISPDSLVDPAGLSSLERSGLREAFRAIHAEQQLLALER